MLRGLLLQAQNPGQRRVFARAVEETVATLERAGVQIDSGQQSPDKDIAATAKEAAKRFVSLVKGFRQIVQEVESILADENRIPPPLMRLIKEMTSESFNADKRVDALA